MLTTDEASQFVDTFLERGNPGVVFLKGVKRYFNMKGDNPYGRRMILRSKCLRDHQRICLVCMLRLFDDKQEREVLSILDSLKIEQRTNEIRRTRH